MKKLNLILERLSEFYETGKTLVAGLRARIRASNCPSAQFSLIRHARKIMPSRLKIYWKTYLQGQPDCGSEVSEYE